MQKPIFLLVAAGFAAVATAVSANPSCAPRETIVSRLQDVYSEIPVVRGLQTEQVMMEVWASPETGTFTVLLTNSSGVSCVVAAGTDFLVDLAAAEPEGVAA